MRKLQPALLLACMATLAVHAPAQTPTWEAEFIAAVPASWPSGAVVTDFNDAGLIVGRTVLESTYKAWYGEVGGGELQLLPLPAGTDYSEATALNSKGLIGGTVRIGGAFLGCLWKPDPLGYQPVLLPAASNGWVPASVTAINDHGDVVGRYGPFSRPYHWSETGGTVGLPYPDYPIVPQDISNAREVIADTLRMDLDTLVVEDLGNPVGLGYNFQFTKLALINDAGDCAGYGITASSSNNMLPVKYSEGGSWKAFSNFPLNFANVLGLASTGDVVFSLGIYGSYVWVDGVGSLSLTNVLDASSTEVNVSEVLDRMMTRAGRLLATGTEVATGKAGFALLHPATFDDLGGASPGVHGTPILGGFGDLTPGGPVRLRLSSAAPSSAAYLVMSDQSLPIPLYGGTLYTNPPRRILPIQVDGLGRYELSFPWPSTPPGTEIFLQVAVVDSAAPGGPLALSNALRGVTQ